MNTVTMLLGICLQKATTTETEAWNITMNTVMMFLGIYLMKLIKDMMDMVVLTNIPMNIYTIIFVNSKLEILFPIEFGKIYFGDFRAVLQEKHFLKHF